MKRILVVLAAVLLLGCYGCVGFLDVGTPEAIRERARDLHGEAVGYRKDAAECAVVIQNTQASRTPRRS